MRIPLLHALLLLAAFAGPGTAATRKPPVASGLVAPVPPEASHAASTVGAGCSIGVSGPRSFLVDYLQPPDDAYYLRVSPSSCATCAGSPGVWISAVSIALEFRVPCSLPVEVAVVDTLVDTTCARPNTGRIVAGPWSGTISTGTTGIQDFTLSLGQRVALLRDSYLRITFTADDPACTADGTRPRLVTTSSCRTCQTWNYYPADTTDLCALLLPGTPVIYAAVDECVSPALDGVGDRSPRAEFLRVSPNPARTGSDIRFTVAAPSRVRVEIHDLAGRRLREVLDARLDAGEQSLRWDGRDASGRTVPAGSYFAVVRVGERLAARRIVFVR
jgi:hypothetical protein